MAKIIVAWDDNYGIGKSGNGLPWRCPQDMEYFVRKTKDCNVLMGRKTFESMKKQPLAYRNNIIVSRSFKNESMLKNGSYFTLFTNNLHRFLGKNTWVIGGAEIYKYCLENRLITQIYATHILGNYGADVIFPHEHLNDFSNPTTCEWEAQGIIRYESYLIKPDVVV